MGYELLEEIKENVDLLDRAVTEIKARGRNKALKEQAYRVALAQYMTQARANGVPVTVLADLARGDPEIARLRMERDMAQSLYESNNEAIHAIKLKIRVLDAQIGREWGDKHE